LQTMLFLFVLHTSKTWVPSSFWCAYSMYE
jgi:hypothetical protein